MYTIQQYETRGSVKMSSVFCVVSRRIKKLDNKQNEG